MATAGALWASGVTCGTRRVRGLTYGRVGVINFAHTHACERVQEGKKMCVSISYFAHT